MDIDLTARKARGIGLSKIEALGVKGPKCLCGVAARVAKGSSIDLTTRKARCTELPAAGLEGKPCACCGVAARGMEEARRSKRRCGVPGIRIHRGGVARGAEETRRRRRRGGERLRTREVMSCGDGCGRPPAKLSTDWWLAEVKSTTLPSSTAPAWALLLSWTLRSHSSRQL